MTHICVGKLTIIGSDNGLSLERRQAIIWTNAGILLIGPLGTKFSEILIEVQTFSLKKIRLKMSSAKCCSFRLGLNVTRGLLHPIGIAFRCGLFEWIKILVTMGLLDTGLLCSKEEYSSKFSRFYICLHKVVYIYICTQVFFYSFPLLLIS